MAKITYNNKTPRVNTPPTANEIFSASDANEIKASVNYLYDNPATGFIKDLASNETPQIANININGAFRIGGLNGLDEYIFAEYQPNQILLGNGGSNQGGGGLVLTPTMFQGGDSYGSLTFNPNVLNAVNNASGNSYTVSPQGIFFFQNGKTRNVLIDAASQVTTTNVYLPNNSGTLALLSDLPNLSGFPYLGLANTFTQHNTFTSASFNGTLQVANPYRTILGGGVDIYLGMSIYAGVGKISFYGDTMEENIEHSIMIPAKSGIMALEDSIKYLVAPNGVKWYIQNDGTLTNNP